MAATRIVGPFTRCRCCAGLRRAGLRSDGVIASGVWIGREKTEEPTVQVCQKYTMHDVAGEIIWWSSCDTIQRRRKKKGGTKKESWEKDREIDKKASEWAAPGGLMTLLVACSGPRDPG